MGNETIGSFKVTINFTILIFIIVLINFNGVIEKIMNGKFNGNF